MYTTLPDYTVHGKHTSSESAISGKILLGITSKFSTGIRSNYAWTESYIVNNLNVCLIKQRPYDTVFF